MSFMKSGWANIQTSPTTSETLPDHDVIEHKHGIACKCNPEVISEVYRDEVHWRIIHNSFDEFLEEDQTEPYETL